MKKLLLLLLPICANAQIINIPDAALKARLCNSYCASQDPLNPEIASWHVDTNSDGEVQLSEAQAVIGLTISTSNLNNTGDITSLAGLEYFTNLKVLLCSGNNFPAFTVASTSLEKLECDHCQVQSLDLSGTPNLKTLNCWHNQIAALDFASTPQIENIACFNNNLTTLNLNGLPNLSHVECNFNQLTTLTIQSLPMLHQLLCNNNQLASIDLQQIPSVQYVDCSYNPITTVNLTGLNALYELHVSNTLITQVDGSQTALTRLDCSNNPLLTSVNVQNNLISYGDPDLLYFPFTFNNCPLTSICLDAGEEQWLFYTQFDASANVFTGPNCTGAPLGQYNQIVGTFTFDSDGDGCDAQDSPCPGVHIDVSGVDLITAFSGNNGGYSVFWSNGIVTVLPIATNPSYFNFSPASYNFDFTGGGNSASADFCVTPNGTHPDLSIHIAPASASIPGFNANYTLYYRNDGNQSQSGTINLAFDETVLDFVAANGATVLPGNLSWTFSNLQPFESRVITFVLNLNSPVEMPPLNLGNQLTFNATIDGGPIDETPLNNSFNFIQTLTNSFDPNEKSVSEGDKIAPSQVGDDLHYTIYFQNLGSASATNISVKDVLAENLDPSSIEIIASSHPCQTILTAGNKLDFNFTNINLPPASSDEPASHGFVTFRIKPLGSLIIGDVIENTANIYFDFNAPVATNTVSTTVTSLGLPSAETAVFKMQPNPSTNFVEIDSAEIINEVAVYNLIGQEILAQKVPAVHHANLDISKLQTGTYLVEIHSNAGIFTKKLIKI
jgi:uncharacterized repeat protein (TIGR01451 family)